MPNNLATYFANSKAATAQSNSTDNNSNNDDDMGPSVSMAVEASNDDEFEKSTFNLKRTRSMGLFNDFIGSKKNNENSNGTSNNSSDSNSDYNSEEDEYDEEEDYENDAENVLLKDADIKRTSSSSSPPPAGNDTILIPQDDNDLVIEPKTHVDYLSHHWNESEISNSWKYIILKKKKRDVIDEVNSSRLENASWRTWAKARNNLKTVSPEIVNWSKDSDVTWLYGPVVSEPIENDDNTKSIPVLSEAKGSLNLNDDTSIQLAYGSDDETSQRLTTRPTKKINKFVPKPILKKRTVTEIIEENSLWKLNEMRKHMNELKHSGYEDEYNDYKALAGKINAQYYSNNNNKNSNNENYYNNYSATDNGNDSSVNNSNKIISSNINISNEQRSNDNDNEYSMINEESNKNMTVKKNNSSTSLNNSTSTLTDINNISSIETSKNDINDLPLSSILTTSNSYGATKQTKTINRHIHFNDRVEQCISIRHPVYDKISTIDDDSSDEESDSRLQNYNHDSYFTRDDDSYYDSTDSNVDELLISSSDDDDDNEDGGLFINARFSRRLDSGIHSPVTDNSSMGSTSIGRHSIHPIIKLLPATTLNYGSDEESDNSDYENNYGNAVSHNVNTYRGYEYMYDYNTVYTGDTSNFLPVDHSGIEDIPEGIDLPNSIVDDVAAYDFNQNILSPTLEPPATGMSSNTGQLHGFIYGGDQSDYSSTDSEQEFIEDSRDQSSDEDDDDEDLKLKRTVSLGKTNSLNSLKDFTNRGSNSSLLSLGTTHSFISGKVMTPRHDTDLNFSTHQASRSDLIKHKLSTNKFIFGSDSDDDDESIINISKTLNTDMASTLTQNNSSIRASNPILIPTDVPYGEQSDMKGFRIPSNSSSPAEVGSSDVAISGCFSPRNDSLKSVASEKGFIVRASSNEI